MKKKFVSLLSATLCATCLMAAAEVSSAKELKDNPHLKNFIGKMVEQHRFNGDRLSRRYHRRHQ